MKKMIESLKTIIENKKKIDELFNEIKSLGRKEIKTQNTKWYERYYKRKGR